MISNKIILECQSCEQEVVITVKHLEEIGEDDVQFCPCCGSDDISLIVKEK